MATNNQIKFNIGFNVDKSGLKDVEQSLREIQKLSAVDVANSMGLDLETAMDQLDAVKEEAQQISVALQNAFNPELGTVNISKFNQEIKNLDLNKLYTDFSSIGSQGTIAFRNISAQLLSTNSQLRQSHQLLDSMATTLSNTVKWTIASSAVRELTGSVQSAYSYVKQLDSSLNDIRIVTEKSADDMERFAQQANSAASSLGATTLDYTNASLLYYQQGLSDEEVEARTDVTLKAMNITGQTASEVSQQLTAVWNGYQTSIEDSEKAIDILAAVAANSASNLEELSTAMSKVASAASVMGVSEEQLAAQISTIISVTRQAPETVGQALKTFYARISNIEAGTDEEGASVTSYTAKMAKLGINVLDTNNQLRDMGDVVEEVGGKWSSFTREQQISLAQTMGGTRQYNNLLALFDNWEQYLDMVQIATDSTGTLQQQQDIYMESTEAHLNQLTTAGQNVFDSLISTEAINNIVDVLTALVNGVASFIDGIGGGGNALLMLGSIATTVFSRQIGQGIAKTVQDFRNLNTNVNEVKASLAMTELFKDTEIDDAGLQRMIAVKKELYDINSDLTATEEEQSNGIIKQTAELENQKTTWNDNLKVAEAYVRQVLEANKYSETEIQQNLAVTGNTKKNEAGSLAFTNGAGTINLDTFQKEVAAYENNLKDLYDKTNANQKSLNQSLTETSKLEERIKDIKGQQNSLGIESLEQAQKEQKQAQQEYDALRINQEISEKQQELETLQKNQQGQPIIVGDETSTRIVTLQNEIKKLQEEAAKIEISPSTQSLEEAKKKLEEINKVIDELSKQSDKTTEAQNKLNTATEEQTKKIEDQIKNYAELSTETEENLNYLRNGNEADQELAKQFELRQKEEAELAERMEDVNYTPTSEDIQILNRYYESLENVRKAAERYKQEAKDIINQDFGGYAKRLNSQTEQIRQSFEALKQSLTDRTFYQGMTQIVGSVGQLASGIRSLQNIGNIISDDSLSSGQKLIQVLSAASSGVAMLGSGISNLQKGFKNLQSSGIVSSLGDFVTSFSTPQVIAAIAVISVLVVVITRIVQATTGARTELKKLENQIDTLTSSLENCNSALDKFNSSWADYQDAIEALEDLEEGTDDYAEALDEANEKAKELIETYGLWNNYSVQNGLITFDEDAINQMEEELQKSVAEVQFQLYSAELANNQVSTAENYDEGHMATYDWYANTQNAQTMTPQDIIKAVQQMGSSGVSQYLSEDLANQIGDTLDRIAASGGIISGTTSEDLDALVDLLQAAGFDIDNINDLESVIYAAANDLDSTLNDQGLKEYQDAQAEADYLVKQLLASGISEEFGYALSEEFDNSALTEQMTQAIAGIIGSEEVLNNIESEVAGIDVSDIDLSNIEGANDREQLANLYAEMMYGSEATAEMKFFGRNATITNGEETETVSYQDMLEYVYRQQQIEKIVDNSLENMDAVTAAVKKIASSVDEDVAMAIMNGFSAEGEGTLDLSSLYAGMSQPEVDALKFEKGQENELLDFLGINEDDLAALGFKSAEKFLDAWNDTLSDYDPSDWIATVRKTATEANDNASQLMKDIQSGSVDYTNIQDNDNFGELMSSLEIIKREYPEIQGDVNVLNKSWLVGTSEYAEALEHVQDLLYSIKLDALIADAEEASEAVQKYLGEDAEIDIEADPSGFKDAMEHLLDAQYAIDVAIHTEAEDEFNSVISAMDDIDQKAQLIGDDFIVAADDIRELNNTFPGILKGLTDLGDGTIQLNEEIVASAMDAAQMEAAADAESAVEKLENQATVLRAKQQTYSEMATAARVLAGEEVDSDMDAAEAQAVIDADLAKLKAENDAAATDVELSNDELVADNAQVNGEAVATSWNDAYKSSANSSYEFAKAAIQNAQAVVAMDEGSLTKGDVQVNYTGASGQSVSANTLEATRSALDASDTTSGTWSQLAEEYDALAKSAAASANDIEGMIAQIGASTSGLSNTLQGVKSGGTGSGSGSSGGSEKEPNQEEYVEDQADRYHDINIRLQEISRTLDRLQKQEDKLVGQDLLNNLADQLAVIDDQIDATNEKIKIAEAEAAEYRAELEAEGVKFDEEGYISNYDAIMAAELAYVNSAVDNYNAMSAEQQDAYKDTLDAIEKSYDEFVEKINDYDELIHETIPGLEDEITDALDQEIQIRITEFTMSVQIRLDMTEAEKDWNEFYRKIVLGLADDDIFGNVAQDFADILSYYNTLGTDITTGTASSLEDWMNQIQQAIAEGGTGSIQSLTDQINGTLDQLRQIESSGWADVYGDNQAQALEDLHTYYTELMQELEDIDSLVDDIEQSYLDMIDEAINAFDEQVDQYEYINDLLNHDINLVSLIYGDDAYEQMARYYEQIEKNNNDELDFLRQRANYAYQMMQIETDDDARKKWQQEWEDSLEALNDKVEEATQNIIDKYTNAINQIIDELNDSVTNGLGLNYVSEQWDLMGQEADIYLDKINSTYEIQSLRNKYLEAIDDTDSIAAQQKLADAMAEQVNYLEQKENLTQYDIDRANLLYQITLKQIAVEEAQNNKSNLRLRRDSQGNYTYQYTADDNAVAQAQQELLDLQNQLYNLDKDAYKSNLDDIYSVYEEFQEKILALYEDQTMSAEEREQMIALYVEYYGNIINDLVAENTEIRKNLEGSAVQELASLYGINVENFQDMTDEEINTLMTSLVPQWESGVQEMADTFAGEGGFLAVCEDAFQELKEATFDYQDSLDEMCAAAGIDLEELAEGYDWTAESVAGLISENDKLIEEYAYEIEAIQDVISWLDDLIASYGYAQDAAIQAAQEAYSYWQSIQSSAASATSAVNSYTSAVKTAESAAKSLAATQATVSTSSSGSGSSSSGSGSSSSSKSSSSSSVDTVTKASSSTSTQYESGTTGNVYTTGNTKKVVATAYASGGYTGEWTADGQWTADDGALAFLHQKELVLNETDTEKILNAVSLVRDLPNMMNNIQDVISEKMSKISNFKQNYINQETKELEQDVHIEANFPNVTNSNQIEEAFNNLVNMATMHVYKAAR